MLASKTYVTLSTAPTEGGISIIQIIGPESQSIIRKVFQPKHKFSRHGGIATNRIYLGTIARNNPSRDGGYHEKIDEVIIRLIPSRKSFSGLETVEINCHGGIIITRKIIRVLKRLGTKQISTKQLINLSPKTGKIDRCRQEALMALMDAKTKLAAEVLLSQYQGALSRKIKDNAK